MRDSTIRSAGASVVLALIALAAVINARPAAEPAADIQMPAPTAPAASSERESTTSTTTPFVYRIGVLAGISTDNFWAFYGGEPSVWDAYILGPTKPALFGLDPSTSRLMPELATAMPEPIEADGVWRVEVELHDHFTWSDATPITADDVAFTFETVRELGLGGGWAAAFPPQVVLVVADGPTRVVVTFTERPTLAVWPHAVGTAPVMPAHHWSGHGATDPGSLYALPGRDPGGGPLALGEVSASRVVSVRNTGYSPVPAPDTVDYMVYEDMATAVGALLGNEIDTILTPSGLADEHLDVIGEEDPVAIVRSPANGVRYLGFNLSRAPMAEPAFRTAVALILDREALLDESGEAGPVAHGLVGPANVAWHDAAAAEANAARYRRETALVDAIAALEEAGYTWDTRPTLDGSAVVPGAGLRIDGQEAPILTILTPGDSHDPSRPVFADRVAAVLAWLGFDARPVETDFDTVVDLAFTPDQEGRLHYDMYLLGWTLGSPALPQFHGPLFASDGARNNTGYSSGRLDQALVRFLDSFDHETAKAALWDMETILHEDLPYLPLYATTITEIYRSDRVSFRANVTTGGLQGRFGGILDVERVDKGSGATLGG